MASRIASRTLGACALAACTLAAATAAAAQTATPPRGKVDLGKREYESNCASCHGMQGRGDGPNKPWLTRSPPDLTMLAKDNGGVMPVARIYEVIDGSREVAGHGSRDMPVWGRDYRLQAAEYYGDVDYDPEAYVRTRILSLIDYLYRLQKK